MHPAGLSSHSVRRVPPCHHITTYTNEGMQHSPAIDDCCALTTQSTRPSQHPVNTQSTPVNTQSTRPKQHPVNTQSTSSQHPVSYRYDTAEARSGQTEAPFNQPCGPAARAATSRSSEGPGSIWATAALAVDGHSFKYMAIHSSTGWSGAGGGHDWTESPHSPSWSWGNRSSNHHHWCP